LVPSVFVARAGKVRAQASKVQWGTRMVVVLMMGSAAAFVSCEHKRHIIGSVNSEFKLIGPDHKIIIESYDDAKIDGITVFISKSQTGGVKGGLGLAEDTSDASVAVRQTGPIKVKEAFKNGEDVFTEKRSVLFKQLHVSRFWDPSHQSFVYVVWTARVIIPGRILTFHTHGPRHGPNGRLCFSSTRDFGRTLN
jgi:CreA protein